MLRNISGSRISGSGELVATLNSAVAVIAEFTVAYFESRRKLYTRGEACRRVRGMDTAPIGQGEASQADGL